MSLERISVEELSETMKGDQTVVIQEVTDMNTRQWVFEGEQLKQLHAREMGWADFAAGDKVIVVCEDIDQCAEYARNIGQEVDVRYLAGGHLAWGQFYHPVMVGFHEQVKVWQIHRLAKGCLSYMLVSGSQALIIDPSYHIDYYLGFAHNQKTDIQCVIDTQIHTDHVSGGARLASKTGSPYYVPEHEDLQGDTQALEERSVISIGQTKLKVISFSKANNKQEKAYALSLDDQFLFTGNLPLQENAFARHTIMDEDHLTRLPGKATVLPAHVQQLGSVNEHGIVATTLDTLTGNAETHQTPEKEIATSEPQATEQEILRINLSQQEIDLDQANQLELGIRDE